MPRRNVDSPEVTPPQVSLPTLCRTFGTERRRRIPRAPRRQGSGIAIRPAPKDTVDAESRGNMSFEVTRYGTRERVELQIEMLSPFVGHLILYLWYAVLLIAVVVESIDFVSWGVDNICGGASGDMRHYDKWVSECATVHQNEMGLFDVRWEGGPYRVNLHSKLVRFLRVVIALRTPDNLGTTEEGDMELSTYPIKVQLPQVIDLVNGSQLATLPLDITCGGALSRCHHVDMQPEAVLNITKDGYASVVLLDLPADLAAGANKSSIGIVYQKPNYTLGTLVWRYLFMGLSVIHLLRFIANSEFTSMLYEQTWTLGFQLALIWYLNPLFALNIVTRPNSLALEFLELHLPMWFFALGIGFMLSVITASMPWKQSKDGQDVITYDLCTIKGLKGYLFESRNIFDPPPWTKLLLLFFMIVVIALDIVSEVWHSHDTTVMAMWLDPFYTTILSLLFFNSILCCVFIVHLHRNLGEKSYLETRPQQLACRVFIFIFILGIVYFIFHFIIFFLHYTSIPGMTSNQALLQLPSLMVCTFLVNIMTLVYTTRRRGELVPIHPQNERWKRMVWPDFWYRWLARHGGSMYLFTDEKEEVLFNNIQTEYRLRQFLAHEKSKKTRRRAQSREASVADQNAGLGQTGGPQGEIEMQQTQMIGSFCLKKLPRSLENSIALVNSNSNAIINMDASSTWFLPPAAGRQAPITSAFPSPQSPSNASPSPHAELGSLVMERFPITEADAFTTSTPGSLERSQHRIPSAPEAQVDEQIMPSRAEVNAHMDELHLLSEDEDDEVEHNEQGRFFMQTLTTVRAGIASAMHSAGRTLIDRPLHALECAETAIVDAAVRRFGDREYLPFFNLETAIDCFNLSLEAYGRDGEQKKREKRKQKVRVTSCYFDIESAPDDGPTEEEEPTPEDEPTAEERPTRKAKIDGKTTNTSKLENPRESSRGDALSSQNNLEADPADSNALPLINVERYGYERLFIDEQNKVQVVIAKMNIAHKNHVGKAPRIVVSFRGTANMVNALQDAQVRRVPWKEMMEEEGTGRSWSAWNCCRGKPTVHKGFLDVWDAHRDNVINTVWNALTSDKQTVYRVMTTGHSLGGALATLCAYSLQKKLTKENYALKEVTVYTFGQPPLGNAKFRKAYEKEVGRHFRVVNESDAVALIKVYGNPVGVEVDIDRYGNYISHPTYIERMFRPTKGRDLSVENHLMTSYAISLNAMAQRLNCPVQAFTLQGSAEGTETDPKRQRDSHEPRTPSEPRI